MSIWKTVSEFHEAFDIQEPQEIDLETLEEQDSFITLMNDLVFVSEALGQLHTHTARGLRIKLLAEEFGEYIKAELEGDMVEISDGLADIHYIAAGTENVYNIPGEKIFNEVQRSNMSKLDEDGKPIYRADGKIMKPDTWTAPDIRSILESHGTKIKK